MKMATSCVFLQNLLISVYKIDRALLLGDGINHYLTLAVSIDFPRSISTPRKNLLLRTQQDKTDQPLFHPKNHLILKTLY